METSKIKRFATEARNSLRKGVKQRLMLLGIDDNGIPREEPILLGGGCIFQEDTHSERFYHQWKKLMANINRKGMKETIEEASYTWFNRLVALHIMGQQGFAEPYLKWESPQSHIPFLVSEARSKRFPPMSDKNHKILEELLDDDAKTNEQFRVLILPACHSIPAIEKCFGSVDDWTELLLPYNILDDLCFVDMLNNPDYITDDDFHSPELLGWLYQFYISERKDEAFAKKGRYDQDDLAPATQIFTPQWIVKYMVENTLFPIYRHYEPSTPRAQYEVETDDAQQCLAINDLDQLTCGDLACGSGHILVELFSALYKMYVADGYSPHQASRRIFARNIVGLDLDNRARQIAQFALLMAAAQNDPDILDAQLLPRVFSMPVPYAVANPNANMGSDLREFLITSDKNIINECLAALQLMDNAESLGSTMRFNLSYQTRSVVALRVNEIEGTDDVQPYSGPTPDYALRLLPYMHILLALTEHYAALCMNPPYMGQSHFSDPLKEYIPKQYPDSKSDLCTVFMEVAHERLKEYGKFAMINMQSWMFLSSFEELREKLLRNQHIDSLLHLGPRTFDELSGEVVQNSAFVIAKHSPSEDGGTFFRLIEGRNCAEKESLFLDALTNHTPRIYYPQVLQKNFEKIPGSPIGYWVSEKMIKCFEENPSLGKIASPRKGNSTSNNAKFLRLWFEVSRIKVGIGYYSVEIFLNEKKRWLPYNKGGGSRKWYGYNENVIDWKDNAKEIRNIATAVITNEKFYMKPGLTWSTVSSRSFGVRYFNEGFIFDNGGCCIFDLQEKRDYLAALLNSKVLPYVMSVISQTLNFQSGELCKMPICTKDSEKISELGKRCYFLSKADWDMHETSWDFKENELVRLSRERGLTTIESAVAAYKERWEAMFYELHANEEELNRQFIAIYGLEDELTPEVPLSEVTILQQGEISIETTKEGAKTEAKTDRERLVWHDDVIVRQLLSYAVGCIMGRYSVDHPGLILASQGQRAEHFYQTVPAPAFKPDEDGLAPIINGPNPFPDNVTDRIVEWVKVTFGEATHIENLNYLRSALDKDISDFFAKDFYAFHKRMYSNRPIYWLFTSKKGCFQCLAYMHRMDPYSPGHIRTRYLLPYMDFLKQEVAKMESDASSLSTQERKQMEAMRKQIKECDEYHGRLHHVADAQQTIDLDDGVMVNYAKMGDTVGKI